MIFVSIVYMYVFKYTIIIELYNFMYIVHNNLFNNKTACETNRPQTPIIQC